MTVTVDVQLGTSPFEGYVYTYNAIYNIDLGHNQHGYELYLATVVFPRTDTPNEFLGFLTLSNACTTSGCSTNPIYWDENSGEGCIYLGCPSLAFENEVGSIPSESFYLWSSPEPSSIMLFGSGILGLAGVLRRKLNI